LKILFVCSRNKKRSRTAETIYKNDNSLNVKSAGTMSSARIKINEKLFNWTDIIFVMEKKHKQQIVKQFQNIITKKRIIILDILDEYEYMDAELIDTLKVIVSTYLEKEKL